MQRFAKTARLLAEAGFSSVELYRAHSYLLAQFLTKKVNKRTDQYSGSAAKRTKIVVDIIHAIRAVVPKDFCVGIKLNSVDYQSDEELEDCIKQFKLIAAAGVDFLEISGGSYENPDVRSSTFTNDSITNDRPLQIAAASTEGTTGRASRSSTREAFFIEFAKVIRQDFPNIPLVVTGGFRTRRGMKLAISSGDCDLVGLARPAALNPMIPKDIIFNAEIPESNAILKTPQIAPPWYTKLLGVQLLGRGAETVSILYNRPWNGGSLRYQVWYSARIKEF